MTLAFNITALSNLFTAEGVVSCASVAPPTMPYESFLKIQNWQLANSLVS